MKLNGKIFIGLALVILVILGIVPFFIGSYTLADSLRGFEILAQFESGSVFNTLNYPNVIDPIISYSVSWWAPGQWLLPFVVQSIGITDYQTIQAVLILFLLMLSFYGYWRLFTKLKFDRWILSISMLSIVASPLFYWQSLMFHGGDLLLLAYFPWFTIALIDIQRKRTFLSVIYYLVLGIFGLYLKTSFLVIFAGGGLFLFFSGQQMLKDRMISNYQFFIAAILVLVFAKFFLLQGETPSSAFDHEGWFGVPNTFSGDLLHAFASPLGSYTNLSYTIQSQSAIYGTSLLQTIGLLVLVLFTIWITIRTLLRNEIYGKLLLFVCYSFFAAMTILYLDDRAVSYEMRHFAPLSFLFIPAILYTIRTFLGKPILLLCTATLVFFNLHNYWYQAAYLNQLPTVSGIKLGQEDAELASFIRQWDSNQSSSLCLIENVWSHSFFVRNNDKLVLRGKEPKIVSGIELDEVNPLVKLVNPNAYFDSYNEVLLVHYENDETNLTSYFKEKHEISSGKIGKYSWYRLK